MATPVEDPYEHAADEIGAMLAAIDDWRGERLARLRELIHEAEPEVVEAAFRDLVRDAAAHDAG